MAAQLMLTMGLSERLLALWMARAKSSLPVPVSPVSSTAKSVLAALSPSRFFSRKDSLSPMMESKLTSCRPLLRNSSR